jgi:transposase
MGRVFKMHYLCIACLTMDTPVNIRNLVIANYRAGMSQRQISRVLNVSQPTCCRIIHLFETTGSTSSNRANCGGHNRLPTRTERALRRSSTANPRATARQIAQDVGGHALSVDISTIRRSLRRSNIYTHRPWKSPSLSKAQCRVRLAWAKRHRTWTAEDWAHVVFSDETAIDVCPSRVQFVRRLRGTSITQAHTTSHRPFLQRVMFWSCISAAGPGPLIPIQGTMNATVYIDTMHQHLLPHCNVWFPRGDLLYQQDNAPCHTALPVTQFFEDNNISTLQWPPYSPDLNCIENLWAMLKRKVHLSSWSSKQQLIEVATRIWENDDEIRDSCLHMIQSMPRRIQECIASKGQYTHY